MPWSSSQSLNLIGFDLSFDQQWKFFYLLSNTIAHPISSLHNDATKLSSSDRRFTDSVSTHWRLRLRLKTFLATTSSTDTIFDHPPHLPSSVLDANPLIEVHHFYSLLEPSDLDSFEAPSLSLFPNLAVSLSR